MNISTTTTIAHCWIIPSQLTSHLHIPVPLCNTCCCCISPDCWTPPILLFLHYITVCHSVESAGNMSQKEASCSHDAMPFPDLKPYLYSSSAAWVHHVIYELYPKSQFKGILNQIDIFSINLLESEYVFVRYVSSEYYCYWSTQKCPQFEC